MLPTKFRVRWPFSSEKEAKIGFHDGRHLGFPIGTILAILLSTSHPYASYQFLYQLALWFRKISDKKSFKMAAISSEKEAKIGFHDGRHLGFPIGTILAILLSTSHPYASYQFLYQLALWFRKISDKKSFKMAAMRPSWISDPNNLSYFRSTSHPNTSYQVSSQLAFQFRRRSEK